MKRFATAVVTVATAASLAVAPANAQYNEVSPLHTGSTFGAIADANNQAEALANLAFWGGLHNSSYENDKKNDYKQGTTADILWGTLLAVLAVGGMVGGAVQQGLIKLPF